MALLLCEIGFPDDTGNPRFQYWPFSTSDLYNWKTQNARFSDNPKDLISLLDSVMFTHQPTWDDCQQLLRILFTTEERPPQDKWDHNTAEATSWVKGATGIKKYLWTTQRMVDLGAGKVSHSFLVIPVCTPTPYWGETYLPSWGLRFTSCQVDPR
ncbi:uncharacterized protein RHO17_016444 [Thomomys bottae]